MSYPTAKEVTTIFTKLFWKDFLERFISTMAQVVVGLMTAGALTGVEPIVVAQTIGGAAVATALKLLGAAYKNGTLSPASLAPAAPDLPAVDESEVTPVARGQRRRRLMSRRGSVNEL